MSPDRGMISSVCKSIMMFDLVKWGILLKVLPLSGLFCITKLGMHWLGWEKWEFDSLTGTLFNATTFTIALILSGTLSDYRSSEGMPSQIANSLESIQDLNQIIAVTEPNYDPKPLQQVLVEISTTTLDWLKSTGEFTKIDSSLAQLNHLTSPILALSGGAILVNRIQSEQAQIRSLIRQMRGNRDTDFLVPAYVLLWLFLGASIFALLLIKVSEFSEGVTVSTFICTAFLYLLFLIQDLDNPFEYDGKSSVDVDLSSLENIVSKLGSRA